MKRYQNLKIRLFPRRRFLVDCYGRSPGLWVIFIFPSRRPSEQQWFDRNKEEVELLPITVARQHRILTGFPYSLRLYAEHRNFLIKNLLKVRKSFGNNKLILLTQCNHYLIIQIYLCSNECKQLLV